MDLFVKTNYIPASFEVLMTNQALLLLYVIVRRAQVKIGKALVLGFVLFTGGCASIVSGTHQNIKIDSEPKGATVTTGWESEVNGKKVMMGRAVAGVTPITVSIPRKDGMIEISKDGYKTQQVELQRGLNYWFFGNVVLTSLLSSSIDTSTGAISEYRPGEFMISMEPAK